MTPGDYIKRLETALERIAKGGVHEHELRQIARQALSQTDSKGQKQ